MYAYSFILIHDLGFCKLHIDHVLIYDLFMSQRLLYNNVALYDEIVKKTNDAYECNVTWGTGIAQHKGYTQYAQY